MMNRLLLVFVVGTIIFCGCSVVIGQIASGPIRLGVQVESSPQGPRVVRLVAGGLADGMGLRPDDIIVSLNRQPIVDPASLMNAMAAIKPGDLLSITVERQGKRLILAATATSEGAVGLAKAARARHLSDLASQTLLEKAGVRIDHPVSASPVRRLEEINVLKEVFIDSASGSVIFVGSYDPTYASGPIPYNALLREATGISAQSFSLEGASGSGSAGFDRTAIARDLERFQRDPEAGVAWMKRVMNIFKNDPDLESDRLRFIRALRDRFGISEEELKAYFDWNPKVKGPAPKGVLETVYAFYNTEGMPQAGSAVVYLSRFSRGGNSAEDLLVIVGVLGIEDAFETFKAELRKGGNDARAQRAFGAALYQALFRAMRTPEARIESVLAPYREGRTPETDLIEFFELRQVETIGASLVNGFTLSQTLLKKIYSLPPIRARVETFGSPKASETMRIFFDADYLLKDVIFYGGMSEPISGHQTIAPFIFSERAKAPPGSGTDPTYERSRMWIQPRSVPMTVSPDGSVVHFGDPRIGFRAEVQDYEGAGAVARAWYQSTLDRYAGKLSDNYNELAKTYPAFHRIREASKILALVRWAKKNGIRIVAPPARSLPEAVPDTVEGFWAATFLVSKEFGVNAIGYSATGGVDFGSSIGDGWVQLQTSPQGTASALSQLAASVAFAERAVDAASAGDLESARMLAEQSGRAMTGDLTGLDLSPQVPMPEGVSPYDAAIVAKEALTATERGTERLSEARRDLAGAEMLRKIDPVEFARTEAIARQNLARSEQSLREVRDLLSQYRKTPKQGASLALKLRVLSAAMTGQRPAEPKPDAPGGLERTRAELIKELCNLRADLKRITDSQRRLSRSILQDVREIEGWEKETKEAQSRARANLGSYLREVILGKYGDFLEGKGGAVPSPRAKETKKFLDRFAEVLAGKDVDEWSQEDKKDLEWAGQTLPLLAGVSSIDDGLKMWLTTGDVLIKTGYDLFAEGLAWEAVITMDKRNVEYKRAVESAAERSEKIVKSIRDVQAELGGDPGATCSPPG